MRNHIAAQPKPVQIRAKIVIPSLKQPPKKVKPNLWHEYEIIDYFLLNKMLPKVKLTWRDKVGNSPSKIADANLLFNE